MSTAPHDYCKTSLSDSSRKKSFTLIYLIYRGWLAASDKGYLTSMTHSSIAQSCLTHFPGFSFSLHVLAYSYN